MDRERFFKELRKLLGQLSPQEREQIFQYYAEIIDDKIEGGMSEAQAVAQLGTPHQVAAKILEENGAAPNSGTGSGTGSKVLITVALVLGSPLWLSLGIAALALLLSAFIVVLALLLTAGVMGLCGVLMLVPSVLLAFREPAAGLFQVGCCLFVSGLAIPFGLGSYKLWGALCRLVDTLIIRLRGKSAERRTAQ